GPPHRELAGIACLMAWAVASGSGTVSTIRRKGPSVRSRRSVGAWNRAHISRPGADQCSLARATAWRRVNSPILGPACAWCTVATGMDTVHWGRMASNHASPAVTVTFRSSPTTTALIMGALQRDRRRFERPAAVAPGFGCAQLARLGVPRAVTY